MGSSNSSSMLTHACHSRETFAARYCCQQEKTSYGINAADSVGCRDNKYKIEVGFLEQKFCEAAQAGASRAKTTLREESALRREKFQKNLASHWRGHAGRASTVCRIVRPLTRCR
jgi:hypothetical protein